MRWRRLVELLTSIENEHIWIDMKQFSFFYLSVEVIRWSWHQENYFELFSSPWKIKRIIPCVKMDLIRKFPYMMMKHFNMEFNFKSKSQMKLSKFFFLIDCFHLVHRFIRSAETNKSNWNCLGYAPYSCKFLFSLKQSKVLDTIQFSMNSKHELWRNVL